MNILLSFSLLILLFFFASCQNSQRQKPSDNSFNYNVDGENVNNFDVNILGVNDDAYQVTLEEYGNFFESKYGLLHQKFNDRPFTGRILTIEKGGNGEYVSSDESWKEGKKHGISARWFSNGIKMYERNYGEGRWHGTVTRWWPNGQKMYVRAYTNGKRHGKEATWRSDGSSINLTEKPFIYTPFEPPNTTFEKDSQSDEILSPVESNELPGSKPLSSDESQVAPMLNNPNGSFPSVPKVEPLPQPEDFTSDPQLTDSPEEFPAFPLIPEETDPGALSEDGLPPLPGSEPTPLEDLPPRSGSEFPELPETSDFSTDSLPEFPPSEESVGDDLPAFPNSPSVDNDLPPLPGLPEEGGDDLPPLSGFPSDDSSDDLPPLPGLPEEGGDDLPPLPGFPSDDSSDDLPPLPGSESLESGLPPLPAFPE